MADIRHQTTDICFLTSGLAKIKSSLYNKNVTRSDRSKDGLSLQSDS